MTDGPYSGTESRLERGPLSNSNWLLSVATQTVFQHFVDQSRRWAFSVIPIGHFQPLLQLLLI